MFSHPSRRGIAYLTVVVAIAWLVAVPVVAVERVEQTAEARMAFRALPNLGGTRPGGTSRGVAWGDYTGDGYPDLAVTNTSGEPLALYRNLAGSGFEPDRDSEVAAISGHAQGVNWVDVNNDGQLDLFVAREEEPDLLFLNDRGRLLRTQAGALTEANTPSLQGCWADADNDGFLDVYIVNKDYVPDVLYRNVDGRAFVPVSGPWQALNNHGRSCGWADVDADGDPDLYVANAYAQVGEQRRTATNSLFLNRGDDGFASVVRGEPVNHHAYSYGVSFMDYDQDGDADLYVSAIGRYEPNMLFENVDGSLLHPRRASILMRDRFGPVKGHVWADFDNDADPDLFVAEGHGGARPEHAPFDNRDRMYLGDGAGNFTVAALPALTDHDFVSAGAAAADFDLDGDMDLFIANWGEAADGQTRQDNQVFENVSAPLPWIAFALTGRESNRLGIGARVTLVTAPAASAYEAEAGDAATGATLTQYRTLRSTTGYASMNEPVAHFGIGAGRVVRQVEIQWPSGQRDRHGSVQPGYRYLATEGGVLERQRAR